MACGSRGRASMARCTSGVGPGRPRTPLVLITLVSESSRSGAASAMRWAIMPPILTPTTCARTTPNASSVPSASCAISPSV